VLLSLFPAAAVAQSTSCFICRRAGLDVIGGMHFGTPAGVSFGLGPAVGLGHVAPGSLFALVEPGRGAGRLSVGWLGQDASKKDWDIVGSGLSLRATRLVPYSHSAIRVDARELWGLEGQMIFGADFGFRCGVFAGRMRDGHNGPMFTVDLSGGV
jgi:hypothetical protein